MTRILVVAPNRELRHSLQFALESEGYDVATADALSAAPPKDVAVTVVDHHAFGKDQDESLALVAAHQPVVLLANAKAHVLSPWVFRTVMKPMLGDSLSAAVQQAVATAGSTT